MPAGEPPACAGFRPFRVAEVVRESDAVRSFLFEPEASTTTLNRSTARPAATRCSAARPRDDVTIDL